MSTMYDFLGDDLSILLRILFEKLIEIYRTEKE